MSSYVLAVPEAVAAASGELAGIGEAIRGAAAAAAPPTTGIVAAAEDEVSAAIAKWFGGYADEFHAVTAQAGVFHTRFVSALSGSGAAYAAGEAGNVSLLVKGVEQRFFDKGVFSPFIYLTGQPLFGEGAVGPAVTGSTGRPR